MKKKCYQMLFSSLYPKHHSRDGQPTNFEQKLISGEKSTTFRTNFPWWEERMQKVRAGIGNIDMRVWTERPYNSKMRRIGIPEQITLYKATWKAEDQRFEIEGFDDQSPTQLLSLEDAAKMDGLTTEDFKEWFDNAFVADYAFAYFVFSPPQM